jgi:predicted double-glycine peptidase
MIHKEHYRENYTGEFVITKITYKDGQKLTEKEYIEKIIAWEKRGMTYPAMG